MELETLSRIPESAAPSSSQTKVPQPTALADFFAYPCCDKCGIRNASVMNSVEFEDYDLCAKCYETAYDERFLDVKDRTGVCWVIGFWNAENRCVGLRSEAYAVTFTPDLDSAQWYVTEALALTELNRLKAELPSSWGRVGLMMMSRSQATDIGTTAVASQSKVPTGVPSVYLEMYGDEPDVFAGDSTRTLTGFVNGAETHRLRREVHGIAGERTTVNEKFDVVAVNIETSKVRHFARDKDRANAESVVKMAVLRRGVDEEFYTVVPAGSHEDGDTYKENGL